MPFVQFSRTHLTDEEVNNFLKCEGKGGGLLLSDSLSGTSHRHGCWRPTEDVVITLYDNLLTTVIQMSEKCPKKLSETYEKLGIPFERITLGATFSLS